MSQKGDAFHESIIKSILFKGRADWYFCFLKAERIAHVLFVLLDTTSDTDISLPETVQQNAYQLPTILLQFVAGEVTPEAVLAEILSLMSNIRFCERAQLMAPESAAIVVKEYEDLAERFGGSIRLSPFVSRDDFTVPELGGFEQERLVVSTRLDTQTSAETKSAQREDKGLSRTFDKGQSARSAQILDFVLKNKGVSIRDIAAAMEGCGEKTIQRELAALVRQGAIRKVGERRWSLYLPR